MRAIGVAGVSVVLVAMVVAITLVPALCVVGAKRLSRKAVEQPADVGVFSSLAAGVQRRPVLVILGVVAGLIRATPGVIQRVGLLIVLAWALGLVALFLGVELLGGPGGDVISVLRSLSPAGIIFMLAGLIVGIGSLTRLWRA